MKKNYLELANTVAMNGAVLPHFRKTDSIMYLPMMKNVREKMRRLNLFDTTESFEAFTLAETLITLTILGVVAAITVPSLINKYSEAANRTKVKKAMAAYEKALNQMIIENDIKGTITAVQGFAVGNCDETSKYFKTIETITNNKCRFKTADRVWWDITDIEHPIIMLNDDYKTSELDTAETGLKALAKSGDNKEVFGMVGTIEDGIVRINDKGVAEGDDAKILNKTYAFINNEQSGGSTPVDPSRACSDDTKNSNGNYISCTGLITEEEINNIYSE